MTIESSLGIDSDQLVYLGPVRDHSGRAGIAFSFADRDILVFDRESGQLLSYERPQPMPATGSQTRPPVVLSYVLYLSCPTADAVPS